MKQRLLWPFALGLLAACAQVRDPQGGPKDIISPVLLEAVPANGSTGFIGDRFVLRFDERVTLDQVREKLLISPPLAKAPDVTVSGGRDVVITLRSPLAANTTYTFNVGDAIADLSEGNHALGLSYVVSTGDHVDSLTIHGRAEDAFTGKPAEGVLVLLHDAADTTTVRTRTPAYFTRSGADGAYTLQHLRPGTYHLTALRDQNANYLYDLPNEDIAFMDSLVAAGMEKEQVLALFRQPPAQQQLVEARVLADRCWRLVLARPAGELQLRSLDREDDPLHWSPEWNVSRDTALMWPSDTTLLVEQRFELREDSAVLDTITYRPVARMPFYVALTLQKDTVPGVHRLVSTRPLARVDTAHIHVRSGSERVSVTYALDTVPPRSLRVIDQRLLSGKAELELLPGAVHDIYGAENDTLHVPLGAGDQGAGELHVAVKADSAARAPGPAVLQLVDATGRVTREYRSAQWPLAVIWKNVLPGAYGLQLIDDRNNDGRWTTGSYSAESQPEKTFRYSAPVSVRAGWTVEVNWGLQP